MPHDASVPDSTMMADPRVPEILAIMSKETGVERERLRPDATIEQLGIPSLDMVQTVFALESHFDIELPVISERTGSAEFATVRDLVSHILATIDGSSVEGAPAAAR